MAVAKKHAAGRRLFVGTSNMDTEEFVIWNMGQIASSNRPDKLKRYRNVLLASSSVPVLFPPVYFEIEVDGKKYYEMHMDGGAQSQLFLRGFMLDVEDAMIDAQILEAAAELTVDLLRDTDYNFPTMSQAYKMAAWDGLGKLAISGAAGS